MMLKLSLQFFAHKKGVGSTKNGRDSESKRLGVTTTAGQVAPEETYAQGPLQTADIPASGWPQGRIRRRDVVQKNKGKEREE